jgi:hypothetical protein
MKPIIFAVSVVVLVLAVAVQAQTLAQTKSGGGHWPKHGQRNV